MLNSLPKPILVFLVLTLGVAGIFVLQKPHSVCDSQLEVFKESMKGKIYPRVEKNLTLPASYFRLLENCKLANSAGGCFEYFDLLRSMLRELNGAPEQCLQPFGEIKEVKSAFNEGLEIMAMLAWGNQPPESASRFGWLETLELGLFCKLRANYIRIYGAEALELLREKVNAKLPGEPPVIQDGICTNCESRKAASQIFSREELWVRSLFSVRCDQYQ